jgi:tetratricopeptide (TPR) repeat protein
MRALAIMMCATVGASGLALAAGDPDVPPAIADWFKQVEHKDYVPGNDIQRMDVDLDGKPDYLIQTRHTKAMCSYAVFRSGAGFHYAGELLCCQFKATAKQAGHVTFTCQDPADFDTQHGAIPWSASPWGYGDVRDLQRASAGGSGGDEYAKAQAAYQAGKLKEAHEHIFLALQKQKNRDTYYLAARIARGLGNKESAGEMIDSALDADPKFEDALLSKADWQWDDGLGKVAILNYKTYLTVGHDADGIARAKRRVGGQEKPPSKAR